MRLIKKAVGSHVPANGSLKRFPGFIFPSHLDHQFKPRKHRLNAGTRR
jgi:hypothetical protein